MLSESEELLRIFDEKSDEEKQILSKTSFKIYYKLLANGLTSLSSLKNAIKQLEKSKSLLRMGIPNDEANFNSSEKYLFMIHLKSARIYALFQ